MNYRPYGPMTPAQAAALRDPASKLRAPLGHASAVGSAMVVPRSDDLAVSISAANDDLRDASNAARNEIRRAAVLDAKRDTTGAQTARVRAANHVTRARQISEKILSLQARRTGARTNVARAVAPTIAAEADAHAFARVRPADRRGSFTWPMGVSGVSGLGFSTGIKVVDHAVDQGVKIVKDATGQAAAGVCDQATKQARSAAEAGAKANCSRGYRDPANPTSNELNACKAAVKGAGDAAAQSAMQFCKATGGKKTAPGPSPSAGTYTAPSSGKGGTLLVVGAVALAAAKIFAII